MAEVYRKKVTLYTTDPKMSMESVTVTVTATMTHGSALKADGTEAAIADAADVVGFIDDQQFGYAEDAVKPAVGDKVAVNVVSSNAIVNGDAIKYSDGAFNAAGIAAVKAFGLKVQNAVSEFGPLL